MDWTQHPLVIEHMKRATTYFIEGMRDQNFTKTLSQPIESPLEAVFLVWWQVESLIERYFPEMQVDVRMQMPVVIGADRFRLDAGFVPSDPIFFDAAQWMKFELKVAIEFDGHEFHERTKEQVERRNYRDRVLQGAGWTVLHFSGSELHRDPTVWISPLTKAIALRMMDLRDLVAKKLADS